MLFEVAKKKPTNYTVVRVLRLLRFRTFVEAKMAAPVTPTRDNARLHVFDTDSDVSSNVCKFVIEEANKAIDKQGMFSIGLSGNTFHEIRLRWKYM